MTSVLMDAVCCFIERNGMVMEAYFLLAIRTRGPSSAMDRMLPSRILATSSPSSLVATFLASLGDTPLVRGIRTMAKHGR